MQAPCVIFALLLIFSSCQQRDKNIIERKGVSNNEGKTKFDTLPNGKILLDSYDSAMVLYYKEVVGSDTLNDGSITCYGMDDSMQYFYLRNGNKLHLLNQSTKYQSPWSLGTLEKDFNTFFMTRIDNGNSCPSSYQVFDKKTGLNLLGDQVEAISYSYLKDTLFMLCDNLTSNKKTDTITLVNVITNRKRNYKLPTDLPEYCDIQIDTLTNKYFKVSFSAFVGENFEMTKIYSR